MNKKLFTILIISILLVGLVGTAYALDFRNLFRRSTISSCNANADCDSGRVCVNSRCVNVETAATTPFVTASCPSNSKRWYEVSSVQKDLRTYDNQVTPDYSNLDVIRIRALGVSDTGIYGPGSSPTFITESLYVALTNSEFGIWREEVTGSDLLKVVSWPSTSVAQMHYGNLAYLSYGNTKLDLGLGYKYDWSTDGESAYGTGTIKIGDKIVLYFEKTPNGLSISKSKFAITC